MTKSKRPSVRCQPPATVIPSSSVIGHSSFNPPMRLEQNLNEGSFGFQIAPMIDVVFVIMLFFMVMAGAVKVEKELNQKLPGTVDTAKSADFTDEQIISISDTGEVSLNDEPFDSAASRDLP